MMAKKIPVPTKNFKDRFILTFEKGRLVKRPDPPAPTIVALPKKRKKVKR